MHDGSHAPAPHAARLGALDSLRGIAAVCVLLHHTWLLGLAMPHTAWGWRALRFSPLNVIAEGRLPVILFFVLSGFVLSRALDQPTPYVVFATRRVIRIWLPFAAATLLATLVAASFGPPAPTTPWVAPLWHTPPSLSGLAMRLLMPGDRHDSLNPVVWSLSHELRLSLIFPALYWLGRRRPGLLLGVTLAAHLLVLLIVPSIVPDRSCAVLWRCRPFWGGTVAGSVALDAYFALFFAIGIVLPGRAAVRPVTRWGWGASLAATVALSAANGAVVSIDLLFGASAAILVWLVATRRLPALMHPLPRWFGRISYSLYLVHVPVLMLGLDLLGHRLPPSSLIAVLVTAAIGAAAVFHTAVERRALALSRRVGGHPALVGLSPLALPARATDAGSPP
jgi:peptidoglycan/LPS O-acetylase OafA/YrhL